MTTLQTLGVFVFLMAYYYFVLRKYNSLGFRIFSLCFFTGLSVCYWWYTDYVDLKNVQQHGIATQALVLKKGANHLDVRFIDQRGKPVLRTQTGGISVEEFAAVTVGQPAPILYNPRSGAFYLASSYQRQIQDHGYILLLPGMLFLIGIACWIFLRNYRVHAHEGTLYEYVTNEEGQVVLDDARNTTTKALRVSSTLGKLWQVFGR